MEKWLIVEDALRDRKGHWLEYVSTFVRELRKLGDEVEVLCDRKAQGFVMEQTGALPLLPESIWHRMGDGAGALKRYLRVPGHAVATFFAMRKVFRGFSHGGTAITEMDAGQSLDKPSGAAFSNSFTSELARDSENTSLTRSASGPAGAAEPPRTDSGGQRTKEKAEIGKVESGKLPATSHPLPATSSPPDWIFVPTVLVHHLLGWWMLLKTGSVPGDSRVLLFFPNLPIRLDAEGQPHWTGGPTTKLMAWLFENLRGEVECGKLVLGVETHAMRRALEGLIRMPVVYLPHPVSAKPGQGEARGEGRESRGGAVFPAEAQRRGDFLTTDGTDIHGSEDAGRCLASQAGAAFSNPFTSELARDCKNTSPTRSASGPAGAVSAKSWELEDRRLGEELVHKSSGGEGSGSTSPIGESSCAGAKPELPVCEQGLGGGHDLTTKHTKLHERDEAGQRLAAQAGAAFSNPFTSELARDSENASRNRSADSPPVALDAGRSTLDAEASASPIVFGCYGAARWEKGSDIFQEAIRLILRAAERSMADSGLLIADGVAGAKALDSGGSTLDISSLAPSSKLQALRFSIQWVEDFRDREGNLISIDPWLREHPQVEVIGRYFEGDEYERRLAETDVMVLPYRSPYQLRVSRVVIEAMLNGMPVIATEGTTLHDQASEHGCVVGCEEGSVEGLAKRILESAANFNKLQRSARAKIPDVEKSFSVDCFRQLLMNLKINKVCQ